MDSLPISGLQHILYCPRQCALIHLEQQWTENRFTAEGRVLHDRAHDGPDESRPGMRVTRGLPVHSDSLSIHGVCDIVEFHNDGTVIPIEYKRGKPKDHRADEVQLCAQALCLEETLGTTIPVGYLFYGKNKRRTQVDFDVQLRELTAKIAEDFHSLISEKRMPQPIFESKKCSACSLQETCVPKVPTFTARQFNNRLLSQLSIDEAS